MKVRTERIVVLRQGAWLLLQHPYQVAIFAILVMLEPLRHQVWRHPVWPRDSEIPWSAVQIRPPLPS
jgi:hypothetical protein